MLGLDVLHPPPEKAPAMCPTRSCKYTPPSNHSFCRAGRGESIHSGPDPPDLAVATQNAFEIFKRDDEVGQFFWNNPPLRPTMGPPPPIRLAMPGGHEAAS